jgi:hypothetical protein
MNIVELNLNEIAVVSGGKKMAKKTATVIPASSSARILWWYKEIIKALIAFAAPFIAQRVGLKFIASKVGSKLITHRKEFLFSCTSIGVAVTSSYIATCGIWDW